MRCKLFESRFVKGDLFITIFVIVERVGVVLIEDLEDKLAYFL